MRLRIISLSWAVVLVSLLPQWAKAQVASSNPLEWAALAEGNELINGQIEKQIKGQTKTALLQNSIAAEFNRIHKWEKQYNSYLKTASGYASSLKACTHLYNDGVRIFFTLGKLGNAVKDNPQGIVAGMGMNNLYIETATELVSVFTLLNDAVAKGGNENMLTGAERSKTLWSLNDRLSAFSRKLHLLYLSIRYYTLNDVWNNVTAGMLDRDNGEAARMALSHWRRAAALTVKIEQTMKRTIWIGILLLCVGIGKIRAQNDPVLAGMILLYTDKAEKELKNQEKVMLMQTTGHLWTKEEVKATTDLEREFNNYLNSFRSIVCYAAQIYGFYYEVSKLTDNLGDFTKQLSRSSANALAVALSAQRNRIYRELILGSVEIVNDIRTACLSENKMTEKERMEIVFGIRPKLKLMNKKLQRLTKAVKYTTMGDIWREIDEGARPAADKRDIVEAAKRRWRQIGKNVRP